MNHPLPPPPQLPLPNHLRLHTLNMIWLLLNSTQLGLKLGSKHGFFYDFSQQ